MNVGQVRDASVIVGELIRLDLRQYRRQAMSYVLVGAVVVIPIGFLLILGTFFFLVSAHAPFHGVSNPKFGLGGYEPSLFYLCVLTSLLLCLRLPTYREDSLVNTVLAYRSPSNFLLVLARVLAPSILVCGSLVIASLAYQVFAVIDVAIEPRFAEPLEPWSLIFVLVNLCVVVFFWTSLGTFVSEVFNSRTIGFVGTALMLLIQAFVSPMLSGNLGSFTFGYAASDLHVSDIAPDYWGFTHVIYWFSVVCLGLAAIYANSLMQPRTDPAKRRIYKPSVVGLVLICMVCQLLVHAQAFATNANRQLWVQTYETKSQTLLELPSVRAIEGTVRIDPGSTLQLDLRYTVEVPTFAFYHKDTSTSPAIPLALNPGMNISSVTCANTEPEYSDQHGIVEIDVGSCDPIDDNVYELHIRAEGKPDPYYLAKLVEDSRDLLLTRLVGERSSIFTTDYVALTPTSHWYPQVLYRHSPLPYADTRNRIDVSLTLELDQKSWTVVTVGGQVFTQEDFDAGRNVLNGKFRSLGLLASDFRVAQHSFEEVNINVVAHKRHAENFEQNTLLTDSLGQYVSETVSMLEEKGIDYPFDQFSIVEIPAQLSWLNEKRGVDTGLDSILMVREAGLPFARIQRLEDFLKKSESEEMGFFREAVEYELLNYWTNPIFGQTYEDVIIAAIIADEAYSAPLSVFSKWVIEIFLLDLLENEKYIENYKYRFDLDIASDLAYESRVNLRYMLARTNSYYAFDLRRFRDDFFSSNRFWETIERSFSTAEEPPSQDLLPMTGDQRLRARFQLFQLAELFAASYDDQEISNALANVLATPDSQPIELPLVVESAKKAGMDIGQILADFMLQDKLPGIHFAAARQAKIEAPDENGPRFVTELDFRNVRAVSANVVFEIAEYGEIEYGETTHHQISRIDTLGPFQLSGETSYRLHLRTKDPIGELEANTFLSLNRGRFDLPLTDVPSISVDTALEANDQAYSLTTSEWTPFENEIIVDDLDAGFEVSNENSSSNQSWWDIRSGWFRSDLARREGLDNGLPSVPFASPLVHTGSWARSSSGACWGRYRHTYAFAPSSIRPPSKAIFSAELPRSGRWVLSYHFPDESGHGDYNIEVSTGSQEWTLNIEPEDWDAGWSKLGTFEIESTEKVQVSVSTESSAYYVYADAIKWTYAE